MRFQTILAASGFFLLALNLHAQKQLPISPLSQQWLAERAPGILPTLQHIFQIPEQKTRAVADRGGAVRLDSAVLYTGYAWGDSFPQTKAEFSYPSASTAVQTEYSNLGGWQLQSRTTQKMDNLGRPTELYAETYDPNTSSWTPDSRLRNYPHGNSLSATDSIIAESWETATNSWKVVLHNATSFDAQDRPLTQFNYFNDDGFEVALLEELSYDANGDNTQTDQSVYEMGVWTLFSRIEREFQQHREIRATTYAFADPTTLIAISKVETGYDAAGNAVLVENFDADFFTGEWTIAERTERMFDGAHRTISETYESFGFDAPPPSRINYVYQNTSGEELHLEIYSEKDTDTQAWVILEKTYYYYSNTSAAPVVQNPEQLSLSPNPTSSWVHISVKNDAQLQVLSAQGQLLQTSTLTAGNHQVDLRSLPAGQYYITVQEGSVRQTGKIVKQ